MGFIQTVMAGLTIAAIVGLTTAARYSPATYQKVYSVLSPVLLGLQFAALGAWYGAQHVNLVLAPLARGNGSKTAIEKAASFADQSWWAAWILCGGICYLWVLYRLPSWLSPDEADRDGLNKAE